VSASYQSGRRLRWRGGDEDAEKVTTALINEFAAEMHQDELGIAAACEAVGDILPPLTSIFSVVKQNRQASAEALDNDAIFLAQVLGRESNLARPLAINRGSAQLALSIDHTTPPLCWSPPELTLLATRAGGAC
jgi:hypothetical protein